jgi:hypothetical protein
MHLPLKDNTNASTCTRAKSWIPLLLSCGLISLILAALLLASPGGYRYGQAGTLDFIEYWSAFRLFSENQNPYNATALLEIQQALGRHADKPLMMWNPPWTLAILAPILALPFNISAALWFACGLFCILLSAILVWRSGSTLIKPLPFAAAALVFYPVWDALVLGQISLLLLLGVSGFYYAQAKRNDVLAGIFLTILSIKPHLFFIFFVAIAIWIIKERRIRIFYGAALSFSLSVWAGLLINSNSLYWWLDSLTRRNNEYIAVGDWHTATAAGWVRYWLSGPGGAPNWPAAAAPLLGLLLLFGYLQGIRRDICWKQDLAPLLCLSVICAPFAWIFDFAVLLPLQILLIGSSLEPKQKSANRLVLPVLLLFQIFALLLQQLVFKSHQYFVWYPPALLLLWFVLTRFELYPRPSLPDAPFDRSGAENG